MRWLYLEIALLACMGLATTAQGQPSTTEPAKTGQFEIVFTKKSPHSTSTELAKRFVDNAPHIHDYDPSQYPFILYVPPAELARKATSPPGLIVLINREAADTIPQQWLPIFDKRHFIFASLKPYVGESWLAGALAMDAVENLKKQYALDPQRIYFVGFMGGGQVALSTSDVFTGNICVWAATYYKVVAFKPKNSPKIFYEAQDTPPPPPLLAMARKEPQVRTTDSHSQWADGPNDFRTVLPRQMKLDGFLHVLGIDVPHADGNYPSGVTLPWFEQSLDFLDSINVKMNKASTKPIAAQSEF